MRWHVDATPELALRGSWVAARRLRPLMLLLGTSPLLACTLVGYDPVALGVDVGGDQGGVAGGGQTMAASGGSAASGGDVSMPTGGQQSIFDAGMSGIGGAMASGGTALSGSGGAATSGGGTLTATGGDAGAGSLPSGGQVAPVDAGMLPDAGSAPDAGQACVTPNACGGCEPLLDRLGSACGVCGLGSLACDGMDALICQGGDRLPAVPGGRWLIDDFEDGDGFPPASSAVTGVWYTAQDGTSGVLTPDSGEALVPQSGGPPGSTLAAHVVGGGFTDWGAAFALTLNAVGCDFDASMATGIEFSARTAQPFAVAFATADTVPISEGGRCTGVCFDHFRVELTPSVVGGYRFYRVAWTALHQSGYGTPAVFDPRALVYLEFQFAAGTSIDFWVDNVAFY